MQDLSKIIKKGKLTPRERAILLVQNSVAEEKDGKEILSKSEIYALSSGWQAKTNDEIRQYNRYIEGWRTTGFAEMDAQTTFLQAQVAFYKALWLLDNKSTETLEATLTKETIEVLNSKGNFNEGRKKLHDLNSPVDTYIERLGEEHKGLNLLLKNTGYRLEELIFKHAVNKYVNKELANNLKMLYEEVLIDGEYLSQEEKLADLIRDQQRLDDKTKEKIADLVIEEAVKFQPTKKLSINNYFGTFPVIELAERLKKSKGIGKDLNKKEFTGRFIEELEKYATERSTTAENLLKEELVKWLGEGLFTEHYTAIFKLNSKELLNGKATKTASEFFKEWREAKAKATKEINDLIEAGNLKVELRKHYYRGFKTFPDTFPDKVLYKRELLGLEEFDFVSGESLWSLEGYKFADNYRKQIEPLKPLSAFIFFIKQDNGGIIKYYSKLLGFLELFKKLSKVYEVDLTYKLSKWLDTVEESITAVNFFLSSAIEDKRWKSYADKDIVFTVEILDEMEYIDLDAIKPDQDLVSGRYAQEFDSLFNEG